MASITIRWVSFEEQRREPRRSRFDPFIMWCYILCVRSLYIVHFYHIVSSVRSQIICLTECLPFSWCANHQTFTHISLIHISSHAYQMLDRYFPRVGGGFLCLCVPVCCVPCMYLCVYILEVSSSIIIHNELYSRLYPTLCAVVYSFVACASLFVLCSEFYNELPNWHQP